ncbi:MAG: RidA family protein [Marivirga sp.]|nr:RidA family protein [Marivirga sp.]
MSHFKENLISLGVSLGDPPKPGGSYVAVNVRGNIAYVAIQFPIRKNEFYFLGRLGNEVTTMQGYEAAKMAAINVLAQVDKHIGFDKILGLNHLDICYQSGDDWDEGPQVANGASDLFLSILGDAGKHTRSIIGVHKLPKNHSVALTASFTLTG